MTTTYNDKNMATWENSCTVYWPVYSRQNNELGSHFQIPRKILDYNNAYVYFRQQCTCRGTFFRKNYCHTTSFYGQRHEKNPLKDYTRGRNCTKVNLILRKSPTVGHSTKKAELWSLTPQGFENLNGRNYEKYREKQVVVRKDLYFTT